MQPRTSRRALLGGASLAALAACSADEEPTTAPGTTPSASPTTSAAEPTPTPPPPPRRRPRPPRPPRDPRVAGEIVTGLAVPWGITFLGDGSALVGERDTGRVLRVGDGSAEPVGTLEVRSRVDEAGESGLLGLALHPVGRRRLRLHLGRRGQPRRPHDLGRRGLGAPEVVLDGISASVHHNGGGLAFGPDGSLFVSTGDAEDPAAAPDRSSYDGKVLRVAADGTAEVWSRGHRNVEGLAFDDQGRLWASEFGDKGADELNLIEKNRDYGWPAVEGDSGGEYADPLAQWPVEDCSPAGIAVTRGRAWLGALRGECVWSVVLDGPDAGRTQRHLADGGYGRIRSVALAPDGSLWVGTSNRDGRQEPGPGDDRLLRVTL